jgi:hypothetical protein
MNPDDQLRSLRQTTITPSLAFTAKVMSAVRDEATMPAPIVFPWKRAIPGFILATACVCILYGRSIEAWRSVDARIATQRISDSQLSIANAVLVSSCGWIFLALSLSAVAIWLSDRLVDHMQMKST